VEWGFPFRDFFQFRKKLGVYAELDFNRLCFCSGSWRLLAALGSSLPIKPFSVAYSINWFSVTMLTPSLASPISCRNRPVAPQAFIREYPSEFQCRGSVRNPELAEAFVGFFALMPIVPASFSEKNNIESRFSSSISVVMRRRSPVSLVLANF